MSRANQWCTLADIVQAALADAIRADAKFQLRQAEAWLEFGKSLRQTIKHPSLATVDLSAGLGRLENLAIGELNLQLGLDIYRPNKLQRLLRRTGNLLGLCDLPQIGDCRLSNHQNSMKVTIKVTRNEVGQWQASSVPDSVEV